MPTCTVEELHGEAYKEIAATEFTYKSFDEVVRQRAWSAANVTGYILDVADAKPLEYDANKGVTEVNLTASSPFGFQVMFCRFMYPIDKVPNLPRGTLVHIHWAKVDPKRKCLVVDAFDMSSYQLFTDDTYVAPARTSPTNWPSV